MNVMAQATLEPRNLEATLNYVLDVGGVLYNYSGGEGSTEHHSNITSDPHVMKLRNGRVDGGPFDLDKQGFRLVDHPTRMRDFFDKEELRQVYYREMEDLVKAQTGARRVV